jgi:hypothetical protein
MFNQPYTSEGVDFSGILGPEWDPRDIRNSESSFSRGTLLATSVQVRRRPALLRIHLSVVGVGALTDRRSVCGVIW